MISGNVSMSNEVNGVAIQPTPTIGMVGLVHDLSHVMTTNAKSAGDSIYVIGEADLSFGGSELQQMTEGKITGQAPAIDLEVEAARQKALLSAIQNDLVASATDLSEGGFAVALCEKVFGTENLGADVTIAGSAVTALFSETQSRFLVTVKEENIAAFEAAVQDAVKIGVVTDDAKLSVRGEENAVLIEGTVEEFQKEWEGALQCLLNSED